MGESSVGNWLRGVLGIEPTPRPREVPPIYAAPPRPILGGPAPMSPGDVGPRDPWAYSVPRVSTVPQAAQPVTGAVYPAAQAQDDPLARFERIALAMQLGERIGSGFDKPPQPATYSQINYPAMPDSRQFGLRLRQ